LRQLGFLVLIETRTQPVSSHIQSPPIYSLIQCRVKHANFCYQTKNSVGAGNGWSHNVLHCCQLQSSADADHELWLIHAPLLRLTSIPNRPLRLVIYVLLCSYKNRDVRVGVLILRQPLFKSPFRRNGVKFWENYINGVVAVGERISTIGLYLAVLTRYWSVSDGRTERQADNIFRQHTTLCIAFRGQLFHSKAV